VYFAYLVVFCQSDHSIYDGSVFPNSLRWEDPHWTHGSAGISKFIHIKTPPPKNGKLKMLKAYLYIKSLIFMFALLRKASTELEFLYRFFTRFKVVPSKMFCHVDFSYFPSTKWLQSRAPLEIAPFEVDMSQKGIKLNRLYINLAAGFNFDSKSTNNLDTLVGSKPNFSSMCFKIQHFCIFNCVQKQHKIYSSVKLAFQAKRLCATVISRCSRTQFMLKGLDGKTSHILCSYRLEHPAFSMSLITTHYPHTNGDSVGVLSTSILGEMDAFGR